MKFLETHFEEYLQMNLKENLHPKLNKVFANFPKSLSKLQNLIFYGPNGTGKYTQMLKTIKQYSPSELKYEKKISVTYNKQPFFFKISDIHYEIDMSLLGCNSKLLWHEIYLQIIDIISAKTEKSGIILCKYFQEIHSELLENFYSYMQQNTPHIDLKYILITEEISFIPDTILNCCEIINVSRPSKTIYNKCLKNKLPLDIKLTTINNIKSLHCNSVQIIEQHKFICDKIINIMINIEELKMLKFRDLMYDIFIYNLNITDCIWYILLKLNKSSHILEKDISSILIKTYSFFQYYNNNYRPIYHLEQYLYYIISIIHKYGV
jgi:hypothetical protein